MLIIITFIILFLSALTLLVLRLFNPGFRYSWLLAVTGAFLAWISVLFWQLDMPLVLTLPSWQPTVLFPASPLFLADQLSWAYAFSLATLGLGALLTAVARDNFPNSPAWAGTLALSGVGILAVLAENPLTLLLAWTAIDLAELITLLGSVQEKGLRERVVVSFATRVAGSGFLLWAGLVSTAEGTSLNFVAAPKEAGFYMLIAAGLRLGILPIHLPFRTESSLRRGYGTVLRLTSAAASLILLARIPYSSLQSPLIPYILGLISIAALYSSWMWFQATESLDARPYWLLGMASLALAATLRANPSGSVAWGTALILGGGALFLSSLQNKWLNRLILLGLFSMSSLPMTLTAMGWESNVSSWWGFWFLLLPAHGLLLAGYFRHARRTKAENFKTQNQLSRLIYPSGIGIMLLALLLLGVWGWQGASSIGAWRFGLGSILLVTILIRLLPRIRALNPSQAHWLKPDTEKNRNLISNVFWGLYYFLRNLVRQITNIFESDGGILWALLFIILFASLLSEGIR